MGSPIELDGTTYTVIGVAPPELGLIVRADVLVPLPLHVSGRGPRVVRVVGRLDKDTSVAQAAQAVGRVVERLEALYADNEGFRSATVVPVRDTLLADVRGPITGFALLAVIIFVAVTANLVGLQFAHFELRARDMAIRTALGATRMRLVFQ